jgi:magnesium chelatase subunit I
MLLFKDNDPPMKEDESIFQDDQMVPDQSQGAHTVTSVRSLKELLDRVTGRGFYSPKPAEDSGIVEVLPFPFLALVGQREMKLALLLSLINPSIGGVLLIGPRGTGKTTAVRSLVDLLPMVPRSLCYYGCLPEDIEIGGIDSVCPDCARKYAEGDPLVKPDHVRLVELPLNAQLEDVIGGMNERAAAHERLRLKRGLLAQADRNLLYVDEVNMLADDVVDALLDASAQGYFTVRRGPLSATYWSRFVLIGSMNPEEGRLRPQIQDRFGLRVAVRGLDDIEERLEAYKRVHAYLANRRFTLAEFQEETAIAQAEIQAARDIIHQVVLSDEVARFGLELISHLKIDSLRAEITLFESARAHAAADARLSVDKEDLKEVSLMSLRLRRSSFIADYFEQQQAEDDEILQAQNHVLSTRDA